MLIKKILIAVLFFSDFLFPVWLVGLFYILLRKGVHAWKAWGVASGFCLFQAYLVSKLVGWNLGGYIIVFVASIPEVISKYFGLEGEYIELYYWVFPPIVLVLIPMIVLYIFTRNKSKAA